MNTLISGLTQEQVESLHKWEIEQSRIDARFEAVDKMVEAGLCDAEKACEVLDVVLDDYNAHLAEITEIEK